MGLRVAVLIKQVPAFAEMELGDDGRLRRDGVELEMNPYCRRAVAKAVELAGDDRECVVFTMGPPSAEDSLREAIAYGANRGVHLCDPAFAGSDTLATARALTAAIRDEGHFDLVLVGRNSVDADTGQVGPEVAELLGWPLVTRARELELVGATVKARCELDDGWVCVETELPAVISCAERLCSPAKRPPADRAAVPAHRISRRSADDIGEGPWGAAGSPTTVGRVRALEVVRQRRILGGSLGVQVAEAIRWLIDAGAVARTGALQRAPKGESTEVVPDGWQRGQATIAVITEPGHDRDSRALLGVAANLACQLGGRVEAVVPAGDDGPGLPRSSELPPSSELWAGGADVVLEAEAANADDVAGVLLAHWATDAPQAVLATGTAFGREVAARIAAGLGAGLTGDAVELSANVDGEGCLELVGWKPAFGGTVVAAITASSPTHLVTVRPGVLALRLPRGGDGAAAGPELVAASAGVRRRLRVVERSRDDDLDALATADAVVAVGRGVKPDEYPELEPLLGALGAELAATRKVTDEGWLPHSRQVGLTGRSISPRLLVALGSSGKLNHAIGFRAAGAVLAVNADPGALVFDHCDVGIVADWHDVVPLLVDGLRSLSAGDVVR